MNKIKEKFNTSFMLRDKISKEFKLDKAIKDAKFKEFDEWFNKLIKKNGITKY